MKALLLSFAVIVAAVGLAGCPKTEAVAYQTAIASQAYIHKTQAQHPECANGATTPQLCSILSQAVSAQHALIDAAEVYCAGPDFDSGKGACQPPAKGTPGAAQAQAKLQSALQNYNQIAADLKAAVGK